jgi:hypothetical protein
MDDSARRARLEDALLQPGAISRLVNAPRHKLTGDEFDRIRAAIKALRREKSGGREIMDADVANLIGTSLVRQKVLPKFDPKTVSFGFDPEVPFPTRSGYSAEGVGPFVVHMFCADAVVAFFFSDSTGYVTEGYRVVGDLTLFGAEAYNPVGLPQWGKIWY